MMIFQPYDMENSEADLHAHAGQSVDLIGAVYDADPGEGILMQRVRFSDGFEVEAFVDEVKEDGAEQQPGESREDWKLRTFALHYGAGLPKIEEALAKREI